MAKKLVNRRHYTKQIAYWGKELRGLLPILELPLDYPRPIIQSYNGDTYQIVIPNKLLEK